MGACLAAAFLLPAGASAQSSSDPEATSPSGTIYEIPLDTARQQAAPRRSPSGDGEGGSGVQSSQGGSTFRSENNFGSSNEVPGAAGAAQGSDESRPGASSNPSSDPKSRSRDQLANASPPPNAAADPAGSGGPSAGDVVLLLVLLLAVALATVTLAIRARRREP
jgi:hypothetical protein